MVRFLFILLILNSFIVLKAQKKIIIFNDPSYNQIDYNFEVLVNNKLIGKINKNSYIEYFTDEDFSEISIRKFSSSKLIINSKDFINYISFKLNDKNYPTLTIYDSSNFYKIMGKIKKQHISNVSLKKMANNIPPNFIGFEFGYGLGTNNIDMVTTDKNETATLSFGGGGNIGIRFDQFITSSFLISYNLGFQFSSLRPAVSNFRSDFSRKNLAITPQYYILLNENRYGGNDMFSFGAGLDYNFNNSLNIDSKIRNNYGNLSLNYENAVGFHLVSNFISTNRTKNKKLVGGYVGLKINFINYKVIENINDIDFNAPNGAGIVLKFGFLF